MRLLVVAAVGAAMTAQAACYYSPNIDNCGFTCASSDTCPAGFDCVDGACVRPGASCGPTIDAGPAVMETFGERTSSDHQGVTTDTWLNEAIPASVAGGVDVKLLVGVGASVSSEGLLQFDLSAIPPGAVVEGATLRLVVVNDTSTDALTVHRVLESWTDEFASWDDRLDGVGWSVAGAGPPTSSDAAELASFTPSTADVDIDIEIPTTVVQAWVADASTNHGVLVVKTQDGVVDFESSESAEGLRRPQLEVTYQP